MNYTEVTGQPCAGKTFFLTEQIVEGELVINNQGHMENVVKFFTGFKYLGFPRSLKVLRWSLKEELPLLARINVFRNALLKFGFFAGLTETPSNPNGKCFVDEGLSHLPFLFLETDPREVVEFISEELNELDVLYLLSTDKAKSRARLLQRGHKRLKYVPLDVFIKKNMKIESDLLGLYPYSCRRFRCF